MRNHRKIILCIGCVFILAFVCRLAVAEISIPAPTGVQADVMTEDFNYLSYFYYANSFSGRLVGGENFSIDMIHKVVGEQSVKYTSGWDPGFWTWVGVYSGGAASPWELDASFNLAMRLRCEASGDSFSFLVDLEDANGGQARFFNDAGGWTNPNIEIPVDGSWVAVLLPLDRFVDMRDPSKQPGDEGYLPVFDLGQLVSAQVRYLDEATRPVTLWLDDVRFIKHTFDQEVPNGDADAMTDTPKAFACYGIWAPTELQYPMAWNHQDTKVGAYSMQLTEADDAWGGGYVGMGLINGQSEESLWNLGGADWYFDGWIKQTPLEDRSQLLEIVDADENMARKYVYNAMADALTGDDWAHVYVPLSRLALDTDHLVDWNRVRKINFRYFSNSTARVTRIDGWSLIPYENAYQYPPKWADAFSENYKDHFDVSAIVEGIGQNMGENGNPDLQADTVEKMAGRQSVKITKGATWGDDSWYYFGIYSGGEQCSWKVNDQWRLHAFIRIQNGLENMTRYIEIKDAQDHILRHDVGTLVGHDEQTFTELNLKLSDFTDDSDGAFNFDQVTKVLLRLNSPGCTPTIWMDDMYLWTQPPSPPTGAHGWLLFN